MASAFVERFSAPRRTGNFILDLHPLVKLNVMISLCALNFLFDSLYGSLGLCGFSLFAELNLSKCRLVSGAE